ncbi:MAG: AAC(3) family N-acetyltransferase [Crocinitomicaceae bacterium]
MIKNWLRSITPAFLLHWNRRRKKRNLNKVLESQATEGASFTEDILVSELEKIGISKGDTILVHSSLSKIGHLVNGPKTFVNALVTAVGLDGHILMPTSPNSSLQLDYIQNTKAFDVLNSKSKLGAITEYFRTLLGTVRSLHPTEPVSAYGKNAVHFVEGHFNALTPYQANSPFAKVAAAKGKILYVGVTLDNAGTSLHTLEDAIVDFKYPVYHSDIFEMDIIDEHGTTHKVKTKVHNPQFSNLRQCDRLIPHFEQAGVLKQVKIGHAKTLLVDADGFFKTMLDLYHTKGITMYTPNGEDLNID